MGEKNDQKCIKLFLFCVLLLGHYTFFKFKFAHYTVDLPLSNLPVLKWACNGRAI